MRVIGASSGASEKPSKVRKRLGLAGGAVSLAVLVSFAAAASAVDLFPGDQAASDWVQSWQASWLDTAMKAASFPGSLPIAAAIVALAALSLYLKGLRGEAGLLVAVTAAGYGVRTALKLSIARPRPPDDLVNVIVQPDGFSFPSGHVMHYVVFLGVLTFILGKRIESGPRRWAIRGAALAALLTIGLSRVYLGVHWVSDVLASYAYGGAVLAGAIWAWQRFGVGVGGRAPGEAERH
jgi:undecaprenyl-diphosphatase